MSQGTLRGQYAGFVSRAVAFTIDAVAISVTLLVVTALVQALLGMFGVGTLFTVSTRPIIEVLVGVFGLLLSAGYFVVFWVLAGQTLGQALMGLRVVRMNGRRITIWCALRRYVGYWVSAIPLGLGFVWVLVDDRRQGWHDKIAATCVVYVWNARPADFSLLTKALGGRRRPGDVART